MKGLNLNQHKKRIYSDNLISQSKFCTGFIYAPNTALQYLHINPTHIYAQTLTISTEQPTSTWYKNANTITFCSSGRYDEVS